MGSLVYCILVSEVHGFIEFLCDWIIGSGSQKLMAFIKIENLGAKIFLEVTYKRKFI